MSDDVRTAEVLAGRYLAAYVDQTPVPRLLPGQLAVAHLRLRNIGSATWRRDGPNPIALATDRPEDRPSPFFEPSVWPHRNRLAIVREREVPPGQVGTFELLFRAPAATGRYVEAVRPVAENLIWFPDLELFFVIDVGLPVAGADPDFTFELLDAIPPLLLRPCGRGELHVRLRNVGRVRWTDRGGDYGPLVQIGTVEPFDHPGIFYDPERWLGPSRAARALGFVLPGQTADFVLPVRAPSAPGSYEDRFSLVAEERGWFAGTPFGVRVMVV